MYLDAGMVKSSSITLTWWRLLFFSPFGHWIEKSEMKRDQHEHVALKNIHVPPFALPTPAELGRLQNPTILGNVYRPHHAITKLENEIWGAPSEKRITLFRSPPEASQKCVVIFFDKLRESCTTYRQEPNSAFRPQQPGLWGIHESGIHGPTREAKTTTRKFTFQSQASRYHKGIALPAKIYVFPRKTFGSTRQHFLQLLRNYHVQYDSII
ncbi:hypothetical protein FPQ18DRAFT_46413 [Pyronema domesticum]|uniref:Uncharacterized protein n=1 Tax=Pyronema omphalodes (strain CBS 100304) TaxID=1076935 RepID=U4LA70_PYROM|nr:hypothetical protein FPQ18DRAFT_46413 [Pyronema domesticum]CCX10618.1 Protein of unknown function [Pyronema omphalodes CBS 100304]